MNKKVHLIYLLIIAVLVTLLFSFISKCDGREVVVEKRVTDTLYTIKHDTIVEYVPKYITKKTIDTLYLPTNKEEVVSLPIEQRHYRNDSIYDLWISGYKPQLDSIKTYPRIEYRTITNNVTREIYKTTMDFYPYLGFRNFDSKVGQVIGLTIKMPKKWMYSCEIGVIDSKMYYGLNLHYILK